MVQIKGFNINVTKELQDLLLQNPEKDVNKAVISKKPDDFGNKMQAKNSDGELIFQKAVVDIYPKIYFDKTGRFYLNVFRTLVTEDGLEVIVTNPKIVTKEDCALYGKGVLSHRQIIPGSELWDNGSESMLPHTEALSKGDPNTKIVLTLTREEVLDINLKPTGDSMIAKIANSTDKEKAVMIEHLLGKDFAEKFARMNSDKDEE